MSPDPARIHIAIDARRAAIARGELLCELAAADGGARFEGARFAIDGFDAVFGEAEVKIAVVAGHDLRYVYVNESYRRIRADVAMVGKTYREVFPEAADGGAEASLRRVIATSRSWLVDDYPTPLPNRDVPAWWQGECVPIALGGGETDGVLIVLWEVTRRHLEGVGPVVASHEQTRVDAARAKLMAQMASIGLTRAQGWRIGEQVRETPQGTVWVLRPIHLRHESPPLEVTVLFDKAASSR